MTLLKRLWTGDNEDPEVKTSHQYVVDLKQRVEETCELARNELAKVQTRKGLDTCYSATYMSQTRDQQRFTISEVAAGWYEPMVLQRIMWPSIARANGQLDPRCS